MSAEPPSLPILRGGQIVLADWRGDASPKVANKLRTAVVVEDSGLFAPNYPNVILVPLTDDQTLAVASLSVPIEPTLENGCTKRCWAVAYLVTATAKARVRATTSQVTRDQLTQIRRQIAFAIGLEA